MSRQIDRDNMTEADARYLNDRGLLSADEQKKYDLSPEPPTAPDLSSVPNVGDVDTIGEGTIYGMVPPESEPTSSASSDTTPGDDSGEGETVPPYDEWSKKDLVDEIKSRNEGREAESRMAVSGTVAELADRLASDDDESED